PLVARVAVRFGVYGVSRPQGEGGRTVPRLGGIAVGAAMCAGMGVALWVPAGTLRFRTDPTDFYVAVLGCAGFLFVVGLADDLANLSAARKLAAQTVAALVAYALGFRVEVLTFGGPGQLALGVFALPVTVLWMVGVTNAFNLIDGLDGLATGIALVALATTFVVAWVLGNYEVALACAALGGALLGFLRYNLRPASIFLGDAGSLFVGFMLAVLSVHGSTKSATAVLAVVPVLVLALPLLDTGLAIMRRWLRGVPVFGADERHLHHRLLAIGLTHRRAVGVLYVLAIALAVLALVLAFAPPLVVAITAGAGAMASMFLLMTGVKRLQYHEFAEAGFVVGSAMIRLRRVIRDQIHARDVAGIIRLAESREHLCAIVADNAEALGFLSLELCRVDDPDRAPAAFPSIPGRGPWRLEYPVHLHGAAEGAENGPWVLRLWCHQENGFRLMGTERAVLILADAIHDWSERGVRPLPASRTAPVSRFAASDVRAVS
ncbi:MAG TPA: MraY family glycosyltransferase, partial [Longimicrobiaceae bacterium]|nr:MraY family glycosyltransferase [Longimicrobiaceae bacterium]